MGSANVHTFSGSDWQAEVLHSDQPVVVDFWAAWCGPCRALAPVVDEVAKKYDGKVRVGKLNVDEHPDIANQYGIMSIPTMLVFKDGRVVEQIVGYAPKKELAKRLSQLL